MKNREEGEMTEAKPCVKSCEDFPYVEHAPHCPNAAPKASEAPVEEKRCTYCRQSDPPHLDRECNSTRPAPAPEPEQRNVDLNPAVRDIHAPANRVPIRLDDHNEQPLNMVDRNNAFQVDRKFYPVTCAQLSGAELLDMAGGECEREIWLRGVGSPDYKIGLGEFVKVRRGMRFYSAPKYINNSAPEPKQERCPGCGHQKHGAVCMNFGSDNECPCKAGEPKQGSACCEECKRYHRHFRTDCCKCRTSFGPSDIPEAEPKQGSEEPIDFVAASETASHEGGDRWVRNLKRAYLALRAQLSAADQNLKTMLQAAGEEAERQLAAEKARADRAELALYHQCWRNHVYSPRGCSECERAEAVNVISRARKEGGSR